MAIINQIQVGNSTGDIQGGNLAGGMAQLKGFDGYRSTANGTITAKPTTSDMQLMSPLETSQNIKPLAGVGTTYKSYDPRGDFQYNYTTGGNGTAIGKKFHSITTYGGHYLVSFSFTGRSTNAGGAQIGLQESTDTTYYGLREKSEIFYVLVPYSDAWTNPYTVGKTGYAYINSEGEEFADVYFASNNTPNSTTKLTSLYVHPSFQPSLKLIHLREIN